MAYSSWTVVYGEQPSAAKWNLLGSNDAFFNDQIGTNFSSGTTSSVWWEEIGTRDTLTVAGDTLSVASLPARKYLQIQYSLIPTGTINSLLRFNNDSAANYSQNTSSTFAAGAAQTSATQIDIDAGSPNTLVTGTIDIINISSLAKLVKGGSVQQSTAGAATAPTGLEVLGKWTNTSAQINRIDIINGSTGDYAIGSELIVRGRD